MRSRPSSDILFWLLLVGLTSTPAYAQVNKYPIRFANLIDFAGKLTFSAELIEEFQENPSTGVKIDESQRLFEETLELSFNGYMYHPNFIDWSISGRFGLTQDRETVNENDFDSDGTLLAYNISARILREKPVSFRLFAISLNDRLDRDFSRPFDLESQNLGFEMLSQGKFPFTLLVETIDRQEEDLTRLEDESTLHIRFDISDKRDPNWLTTFSYEREDTDEITTALTTAGVVAGVQDNSFLRNEFRLSNFWTFGPEGRKRTLAGDLRYLHRTGFYFNKIFSASQHLEVPHSETLTSRYDVYYSTNETETEDEREILAEVGFTKSIYESLVITGRAYMDDRDFIEATEDIIGGAINFDYRKITPIGLFSSGLNLAREYEKESSTAGALNIRDESVTLTGTTFSTLSEAGIKPGTVVVMNSSRTVTFVENIDYILRTIGSFTELARLIGGAIADGEAVLVDYTVNVARKAKYTNDRVTWRNRLELDSLPLTFFLEYDLNDRQLRSGDDPGNLDTEKTWLAGIQVFHNGLFATAEHEVHDQELSPGFVASRLDVRYTRQANRRLSFTIGADAEKLTYQDAAEFGLEPGEGFRDTIGAYANLTVKLSRNVLLRVLSDYTRGRGRNEDMLGHVGVIVEWKLGDLDFSVEAHHNIFEQEGNSGTESRLLFNVSRYL